MTTSSRLTERQRREVEYHKDHAARLADRQRMTNFDAITSDKRRWWNAYWDLFTYIRECSLSDKKVLIVGCGEGMDALQFAKMGADVYAFDLSPEMLALAVEAAEREKFDIRFSVLPAEQLTYSDGFFDIVFARDILHHVDIQRTLQEIRRVSKEGALLFVNEIYSHSWTEKIRRSRIVEKFLYPGMQKMIYGDEKPYITVDEKKLLERDVRQIKANMGQVSGEKYFNFIVTRLVSDNHVFLSKFDRVLLMLLKPISSLLGGRVVLYGVLEK